MAAKPTVDLNTVARGLSPHEFMSCGSFERRLDLVKRLTGRRLYSHHFAAFWAAWLSTHVDALSSEQVRLLMREMLVLSPYQDRAEDMCAALLRGTDDLPSGTPVFMITSCSKYLPKARMLRASLLERGAVAWIITGDPKLEAPQWHAEGCCLAVADTYEALPLKVAKGVEAIVARYGACPVVKIDDDCQLLAGFEVGLFAELARSHDYVGVACKDPMHDRLWHDGKTSQPVGIYSRRFHGAWARGACYLLAPATAMRVAKEALRFPGEFSCEHYEDKAMGDFLRREGVVLTPLPGDAAWGITFDATERSVNEAVQAQSDPAPAPDPAQCEPTHSSVRKNDMVESTTSPVSRQRIPKVLHLTWVGDDSRRPDNCIQTWIQHNPEWTIKLWGNEDLQKQEWINARHIRAMWNKELNGVADLMRWEILYNEGGIVVDADSICVRPLDDWLLEADAIACWENEITRPRLIGCNMVGSIPENPFFGQIIQDLHAEESVVHDMAWKTVGPLRLTTAYFKYRYTGLTILPSHMFIPDHFSGVHYDGGGIVYAKQEWASTHRAYDKLHLKQVA